MGSSWLSAARAAIDNPPPDQIVINAKVTTMDPAMPAAEAFAVRAGRFLAVGSTADIKSLAGPKTRTYDAKGMMIVPGFIDCTTMAAATFCCTRCWSEIPISSNSSPSRASSTS